MKKQKIEECKTQKMVKTLLATVVAVFVAVSFSYCGKKAPAADDASKNSVIQEKLVFAAEEINKHCPITVDADTRLDNVGAMPNNTLQYNYTIVSKTREEVDTLEFKKIMEPILVNNMKTNPQMKRLRENKVNLNYQYKDKNGNYLCSVSVDFSQY